MKWCWVLHLITQSSVFHVIASLTGKDVHFAVSLLFVCVCPVKSTDFGVVSNMSTTGLRFRQKRALQNRTPERNSANFSTYVLNLIT